MLKSTPPSRKPSGKARKYLSYREAWTRIKVAQEQGFYLEAVTLVESIISDRLVSYLVSVGETDVTGGYVSLHRLIRRWRERVPRRSSICRASVGRRGVAGVAGPPRVGAAATGEGVGRARAAGSTDKTALVPHLVD